MGQEIERLAQLVAETTWESIPESVQEQGKLVLLDTLGVILAGSERPEVQRLRARLAGTGAGASVYARGFPEAEPRMAALLNGISGRSIEMCEGYRYVACQAAVQALPAALALGEQSSRSGRDVLMALILGYEVAARIGLGATARPMAHQNGQWPLVGAAAAGARVLGFDAMLVSRTLRAGAILVLVPSYSNAVAGATILNVAGGMSGLAGALAPELVLAGFESQPDAVEEAFSELVADGFDPRALVEGLGERWEIRHSHFRLRACCNPIYSALDALEDALAELRPKPEEIESIDVETYRFASVMREPHPRNYLAAKYSLPHAAAAIIVRGNAGFGSFSEEVLQDPRIVALRERVHVTENPEMNREVPRLKPARVTVTLKDGRSSTHICESARGDALRPYGREELKEKFRELAGQVLTPERVADLEALVDRFDGVADVRELPALLR